MGRLAKVLVLLGWCLALFAPYPAAARQTIDPQVNPIAAEQFVGFIRTDGQFVAWVAETQTRYGRNARLYAQSLQGGTPSLIASENTLQQFPGPQYAGFDLDNGRLVVSLPTKLLLRDLRSGATTTLVDGQVGFPRIAGDWVTWWEYAGTHVLKARNLVTLAAPVTLTTLAPRAIYEATGSQMSDRWIAWQVAVYPNGKESPPCYTIFYLPLSGGTPQPISTLLKCNNALIFALEDDTLAYTTDQGTLLIHNLSANTSQVSGPHGNENVTISGRYLFWDKGSELWGYDPKLDSAFKISTRIDPNLTLGYGAPSAHDGALAWIEKNAQGAFQLQTAAVNEILPNGYQPRPDNTSVQWFSETGHTIRGTFKSYWEQNGGLYVFGLPLTEEYLQKTLHPGGTYLMQYFERQRFEHHPEFSGTPYEVLLGRLGAEALVAQNRSWESFPKSQAPAGTPYYFPQTGHTIAPEFQQYWRTHGLDFGDPGISEREALALWGYPLSPPMVETFESGQSGMVQWFERARFEYHKDNPAAYKVLITRLAANLVQQNNWK